MRDIFTLVFVLLIVILGICSIMARRSSKSVAKPVSYLLVTFIVPITGNMILTLSQDELLSTIGSYTYFIGMTLMAFSLFDFTLAYCGISWKNHKKKCYAIYALLVLDIVQYLFNPFFGHAFNMTDITVDGELYYRLVPHWGQAYHRIVVYLAFLTSLIIFVVKTIRVPRVYKEKYYIIMFTMILAGIWQSYSIFFGGPIDRSMIGFAICALLFFYFSILFRPLKLLDRMLANIASQMPEALFFFDASERCIWFNDNGSKLLGVNSDTLDDIPRRLSSMFKDLGEGQDNWFSRQSTGFGDNTRYFSLERHVVTDAKERKIGSFLNIQDHTADVHRHQREMYEATHDKLTGLLNRDALFQSVKEKVSQKSDMPYWVAYFDIKDFKLVNDIFGNTMGDFVLQKIAKWLRVHSSSEWIFGRLTGDAFGICFSSDNPNVKMVEQQISKFSITNGTVDHNILIHVGLYKITDPNIDVPIMFDRAKVALNTVKGEFSHHVAIYDDKMRDQVLWDQKISAQLEKAIKERQLQPYLQPIVDNSGKIIGSEILVRWIHPQEGFLPPIKFVPVFERNGMIADVDKYMWRCACEALASWDGDNSKLFISINISPKDFYFMDVYSEIMALVKEYRIDPSRLRVEITESVMMTDIENRIGILNKFRESGFIVEMDDFGSGYSSLNQLKDMPLDGLKIDMKFLGSAINDKRSETILRYVLRMSQELGLFSLTEGVETKEQYDMLNEMGCNLFQGYYFAKPMPLDEFEKLIAKG